MQPKNLSAMGGLGSRKFTDNVIIQYSAYNFLFTFNTNYVSILYWFWDMQSYPS